jgi:hypothetical protein
MILGSKSHTAGDTRRWRVDYSQWLENPDTLVSAVVTSSSATATVDDSSVLGKEVVFFISGGMQGERATVSIVATDTSGNVRNDSLIFTVLAP